MLKLLRIRDFALIRELEIEFGPGLNLLTGETGSGKSIIVDCLGLLSGERASQEMIRTGSEAAVLEGAFQPDSHGEIQSLLESAGIEPSDEILIRREISVSGRGRIFINNCLATASLLKTVGEHLADIHGQHDRQVLLELPAHLQWLDRFGGNQEKVKEIRGVYRSLRDVAERLESLRIDEQERLRQMDILQFQLDEIRRSALRAGEKEELDSEKRILANRERVYALASEAYGLLYENEPAMLAEASRLLKVFQELETFDPAWSPRTEALQEVIYRLEDLSYASRDYTSGIDFAPGRLDEVEQRLEELDRLSRKYGNTVPEIIAYGEECASRLGDLASRAETLEALNAELGVLKSRYLETARRLSDKRRRDAARLEREIRKEFSALSMDKMELAVRFHQKAQDDAASDVPASYGPGGLDRVEFLIAANRGEEAKPLAKTASGGELSRIMLAIRTLCGDGESGKTLVFDEVDTGIGGRVAEAVGRRLRAISTGNQVLCVTHLPQIAAFADRHFSVRKEAAGARTEAVAELLQGADRTEELARMLGGEVITETTRRHADEMIARAAELKKNETQGRE
jgi:DNA repair protein RecN (Recombination protein N)